MNTLENKGNKTLAKAGEVMPDTIFNNYRDIENYSEPKNKSDEKELLQTVADWVMQGFLFTKKFNPKLEMEHLYGDAYALAKVTKKYFEKYDLVQSADIYILYNAVLESKTRDYKNFQVVVTTKSGKQYKIITSPYVSYKNGKVLDLDEDTAFDGASKLTEYELKRIEDARSIIYELKSSKDDKATIKKAEEFISGVKPTERALISYYSEITYLLNQNDNYKKGSSSAPVMNMSYVWRNKLDTECVTLKEKNEMEKWIYDQEIMQDPKKKKKEKIFDEELSLKYLNPRYYYENEINGLMINPKILEMEDQVIIEMIRKFLNDHLNVVKIKNMTLSQRDEYGIDRLSVITEKKICTDFLPDKCQYEVWLCRNKVDEIKEVVRKLKSEDDFETKCKFYWLKQGYDKQDIENEDVIYVAEDSIATAIMYSIDAPEAQRTTRFMSINPKLKY